MGRQQHGESANASIDVGHKLVAGQLQLLPNEVHHPLGLGCVYLKEGGRPYAEDVATHPFAEMLLACSYGYVGVA